MHGEKGQDTEDMLDKVKQFMLALVSTPQAKGESRAKAKKLDGIMDNEPEDEQANLKKEKEGNEKTMIVDERYFHTLYEKKKSKLFNKIKERQRKFISFQDSSVDLFLKELNDSARTEGIICSVTKEPLSSKATYFMYAQLHFSNVIATDPAVQVLPAVRPEERHRAGDICLCSPGRS